jgi:hypothetical protein
MNAYIHAYTYACPTRMYIHTCVCVYRCWSFKYVHPCILHTYLQARGITAPVLLSLRRENISAASQNLDARVSMIMSELTENEIKTFKTWNLPSDANSDRPVPHLTPPGTSPRNRIFTYNTRIRYWMKLFSLFTYDTRIHRGFAHNVGRARKISVKGARLCRSHD